MLKRILCALLCAAMLIPLASCSNSDVNTGDETQSGADTNPTSEGTETTEETKKYLDDMPETMDFGGTEIRFIVEEGNNGNLSEQSIRVEEDTGDVVDSAIFQRNGIVSERLGISITLQDVLSYTELLPLLRTSVSAGTPDYDIVGFYQYYGVGAASEGLLYNLNNLKYNDFTREYWAGQYMEDMSYKGANFWATGDLSLRYTGGMYVTFVNDRLWTEYYPDTNIYDIVDEGNWTLDKLYDVTSTVYVDVNGSTTADASDVYGFALSPMDTVDGVAAGCLVEFGSVDEEGNPYVCLNNERTYTFYDKLYKIFFNNQGFTNPSTDDSITIMTRFSQGNYMMTVNKLYQSAIYLRDMEDDFKIIPIPKLDETQTYYNTRVHDSVTLFGTPITAIEKFDAISATLEAMAALSYEIVSPAYYEVALKTKFTRDSDSGRMIDLIAQNVSCDFITLYSNRIGDVNHFFRSQLENQVEAISSKFKTNDKVWAKAVEKLLEDFEEVLEAQS